MNVIKEACKTLSDLWSLMIGLRITARYFVDPVRTVRYPWKAVPHVDTYKGHLLFVASAKDPAKPRCISCGMCALSCPSHCLTVVKRKPPKPTPEEAKAAAAAKSRGETLRPKLPKDPEKFLYDYARCSLCGTCAENCPTGSLAFKGSPYLAGFSREEFRYDLVAELKKAAAAPAAEPARASEA